jgi:hypothetical protein
VRIARLAPRSLAVALMTTACGSPDAARSTRAEGDSLASALTAVAPGIDRPSVAEGDSAGLHILTLSHVPPADDPDWEWGLRVTRSIATVRGATAEPILFDPQSVTRLSDGRIVVVDRGEDRLAVIEPGTDTVGLRFARVGQGPRELWGFPLVIWALEDGGIAVADPPSHKIVHFTRDGEFVTSRPTPQRVLGDRAAWQRAERTGELYAKNIAVRNGRVMDSVVAFRAGDAAPRPVAAFAAHPVDPTVTWPAALNWWSVLPSGTVVMYRSDRPVFRVARPDGSQSEIRLPLTRAAMSEAEMIEVEGFLGGQVSPALAPGGRGAEPVKTIGNGLEPFGDSAFVLRQYRLSTPAGDPAFDGSVWRVIGLDGGYRGVIRFPPSFGAVWTDGTDAIGLDRDSLGVATIRELTLEPPRALR